MSFLEDTSDISTSSGLNTNILGKPVCVISYIDNKFESKEGTYRTFSKLPCSRWTVPLLGKVIDRHS